MKVRLQHGGKQARRRRSERGQALLEFTACFLVLLAMVFGLVDISRILHDKQVMSGLTRQGSNLASRGTSLQQTVSALVTQGSSLDLGTEGRVIVTSVAEGSNGSPEIKAQAESTGGIPVTSIVGSGAGKSATVPSGANSVLKQGQTIYVTEVFYSFRTVTPIGSILKMALPFTLYESAYF
jgi:hypothetical protein